eukprot:NODE_592_length_1341_cov_88.116969_g553_i0.p1 GENE.NODE_592_length_1341_cov_88.116969_g553_i0~~NODE_592_length_1341_cov_88.116969_g553_i0.p1  ORF type:complete len:369 (+),score=48.11 NODE_592_length_1341_cov_88.116969_g553_i0:138-1244(+)
MIYFKVSAIVLLLLCLVYLVSRIDFQSSCHWIPLCTPCRSCEEKKSWNATSPEVDIKSTGWSFDNTKTCPLVYPQWERPFICDNVTKWQEDLRVEAEFGYEIILSVPFVYHLHLSCFTVNITTFTGMRPWYYFLQADEVHFEDRERRPNLVMFGDSRVVHIQGDFDEVMQRWQPPPLREFFSTSRDFFAQVVGKDILAKPLWVIENKHQVEWAHVPVNFLDVDTLLRATKLIEDAGYQVVYVNLVGMNNEEAIDLGEKPVLRQERPSVLFVEELHAKSPLAECSLNEFYMLLYAHCDHYISVQGGGSVAISYFAKINIIYAAKGIELETHDFENYYHRFNNATIFHFPSYPQLLTQIELVITDEQIMY